MTSLAVLKSKRGAMALAISLLMLIGGFALLAPMEEADATTSVATLFVENGDSYSSVSEYTTFAGALEAYNNQCSGNYLILLNEDVNSPSEIFTVKQLENKNLILDGDGHDFCGEIRIDGRSDYYSPETLDIQNFNFGGALSTANKTFIWSDASSGYERYPHNVTVFNCTFVLENEDVGIKMRQGWKITIDECVAHGGLDTDLEPTYGGHSLFQGRAIDGLTITDCEVHAAKGIAVGNSMDVEISRTYIDAWEEYGIRMDANSQRDSTVVISDCDVEAYIPVSIRNAPTKEYTVLFEGTNNMTASNDFGVWLAACTEEFTIKSTSLPTGLDDSITVILEDDGDKTGEVHGTDPPANVAILEYPDQDEETFQDLQDALDAYDVATATGEYKITLISDINEPTKTYIVKQWADKNLELNGNSKKFTAQLSLYGQSRHTGDEALLITDFRFEGDVESTVSGSQHVFIEQNDGSTGVKRYPHKVTISNCVFTMPMDQVSVGIKIRQGYNFTVSGCFFYNGALPVWMTGGTTVTFEDVYSEGSVEGIHVGTVVGKITFEGVSVQSSTYGIRLGGSPGDGWGAWELDITRADIDAKVPIVVRTLNGSDPEPIEIADLVATFEDADAALLFVASEIEYTGTGTIPDEDTGLVVILNGDDALDLDVNKFYGAEVHSHFAICEDQTCTHCEPNVVIPGLGGHTMSSDATCTYRYCTRCIDYSLEPSTPHTPNSVYPCLATECTTCQTPLVPEDHSRDNETLCVDTICYTCGIDMPAEMDHDLPSTATCIDRTCEDCGTVVKATESHDYRTIGYQNVCRDCGHTVDLPFQDDDDDDWYLQWLAQQQAKAEAERLAKERAEQEAEEQKKVAAVALATGVALIMALLLMSTYRRS